MALPAVEVSQSPEEKFREYLASRPDLKRFSQPQKELVAHIFARHKHFDTNELLDDLKDAGRGVSRATVYRTLKLLVDAGLLRRIEIGPRTVFDHDYGYPAHDHLVCTQCGTMIEFQHERLDEALQSVASEHQFQAESRSLVIRGVCGACNSARAARRRLVM
jgi:Fur family ferric uptake transcriptional regulator